MIPLLFFLCMVTPSGYDCSYTVEMVTIDELNELWWGNGWVAGMFNPNTKTIYLADVTHFSHEYRHAFCYNDWIYYDKVHNYCVHPHFKVIGA